MWNWIWPGGGWRLDAPIDVAALCGLSTFAERRAIRNGQLQAITSTAWNTETVTSVATYSTAQSARLTAVANVANVPVGARVSGTGVGREVYVTSKNISAGTVELSQPLWAAAGTRTFTFDRYKYMLDFSGFTALSKFEVTNVEMLCNGLASTIMLAPEGELFRLAEWVSTGPRIAASPRPGAAVRICRSTVASSSRTRRRWRRRTAPPSRSTSMPMTARSG